ncbi:MAG: GTP-binding protein [Acidimicrobiales bacterium]
MAGTPPIQLEFVMSGDHVDRLPETAAEVAIVGRSNVGKSSLVNALSNRKRLALVSNTPGRTRLLNLFSVVDHSGGGGRGAGGNGSGAGTDGHGRLTATVMDLPGYGYASASKDLRAQWQQMIERYLLEREGLEMIIVLVDGEIGPTKLDVQMLDWLRGFGLPHTVVATKHDKVKSSKRDRRKRDLAQGCMLEVGDVVWVSAAKGTGIDRLRSLIRTWIR